MRQFVSTFGAMKSKLIPLIAIAFVLASISTAVFYSLFAGRLNATPTRSMILEQGGGLPVPEGMRAVSVHVSDSSGVVALLKPGYKVDVQMFASQAPKALKEEMKTFLRGLSVLAISAQPEQSSQGYFNGPVVTLIASAQDAEQLARADSYSRLRIMLRNPHERSDSVPAALNLRVTVFRVSDQSFRRVPSRMSVIVASERLVESLKTDNARVQSESLVAVPGGRNVTFDLPGDGRGVRLNITAADGGGNLRIRPEVTRLWSGHLETHSVETEVDASPGHPILISGLDQVQKRTDKFGHLIVLIVRAAQR